LSYRGLIGLLSVGVTITSAGALAQNRFPAEIVAPMAAECTKDFSHLRQEVQNRGRRIKDAAQRHAQPDEACRLIGDYSQAELKLIEFVDAHAAQCAISAQITDPLRNGHKATQIMQNRVCTVAHNRAPGSSTGDYWPSSVAPTPQERTPPRGPTGDFGLVR
jgi:hypothetical protein